jgi:hypothetical protein
MMQHLLKLIKSRGIDVAQENVMWVLTVPAIWDEPAKQFMREVAVDVSFLDQ